MELLEPFILKWEGGFADDPVDRGGATNKGVTLATFRHFYGAGCTSRDLRAMTETQWLHIFKTGYWDRWQADRIVSQSLADILVDWVWASGSYGITRPQKILGVEPDGIVGERTLSALNGSDYERLFHRIKVDRIAFVENIVRRDPSQRRFLRGWLNRIDDMKFKD